MYYIVLGLIITFSLIRKAGKATAKRSKRGSTPKEMPTPQAAGASLSELLKEIEKAAKAQAKQSQSQTQMWTQTGTVQTKIDSGMESAPVTYRQTHEAQSLETIIDEEELYLREQAKRAQTAPKAKKSANNTPKPNKARVTAQPPKGQNSNNKGGNNANSEEFDLREAVIYAEILKPKFEE